MSKLPSLPVPVEEPNIVINENPLPDEIHKVDLAEESEEEEVVKSNVNHQDVFDDVDTLPPTSNKKKRVATEAQKAHLAKIRVKALATRKKNAELKKQAKAQKKAKAQVVEEPLINIQEPLNKNINYDITPSRPSAPIHIPEPKPRHGGVDKEFVDFIVRSTIDQYKGDRKKKKERIKYEETIKQEAYNQAKSEMAQLKPHKDVPPPREQPTNLLFEGARGGGLFRQFN